MAKRDSDYNEIGKHKEKAPRFNDVVFISFPFTKEQLEALKQQVWDMENFDIALANLSDEGYKITFSWDDYSAAYSCFIIPKGTEHKNAGYILTGRGSVPYKALRQAWYVHNDLFARDWSGWTAPTPRTALDD